MWSRQPGQPFRDAGDPRAWRVHARLVVPHCAQPGARPPAQPRPSRGGASRARRTRQTQKTRPLEGPCGKGGQSGCLAICRASHSPRSVVLVRDGLGHSLEAHRRALATTINSGKGHVARGRVRLKDINAHTPREHLSALPRRRSRGSSRCSMNAIGRACGRCSRRMSGSSNPRTLSEWARRTSACSLRSMPIWITSHRAPPGSRGAKWLRCSKIERTRAGRRVRE